MWEVVVRVRKEQRVVRVRRCIVRWSLSCCCFDLSAMGCEKGSEEEKKGAEMKI